MLANTSRTASAEDVAKVSEELSQCRNRLEAGIQENKKNRQVIEDINQQLERFRRKTADSWKSLSSENISSGNFADTGLTPLTVETNFWPRYLKRETKHRHRSLNRFGIGDEISTYQVRSTRIHQSSPRLTNLAHTETSESDDDVNVEEVFSRLRAELFKNNTLEEVNEMLREENDAALAANEHLRVDASTVRRELESLQKLQMDDVTRYRAENTRYRNQVENQNRKLLGLWKEFSAVKRQLNELRTSASKDMDRQVTEFTRCALLMQRAIRQHEEKNREVRKEVQQEKDAVLDETLFHLNTATENFMKAEERSNELSRLLKIKDEELNKEMEKNRDYHDGFQRVVEVLTENPVKYRARSQSPISRSYFEEKPLEVARHVRRVINSKNEEVKDQKEVIRRLEEERDKVKRDLEKEEQKRREEREAEAKRSHLYTHRENEIRKLDDEIKKLNEKIRVMEEQRESQEKLVQSVQNSLTEAHHTHKQFIEELVTKHREELHSREDLQRNEYEHRYEGERHLFEKERREKETARKENDGLRESVRRTKGELAAMQTVVEDKNLRIEILEDERIHLKKNLEHEQKALDERELELQTLRDKLDGLHHAELELRAQMVEAQNTATAMQESVKLNDNENVQLRDEVFNLSEKIEQLQSELEGKEDEITVLNQTIHEKMTIIENTNISVYQLNANYEEVTTESTALKEELKKMHEEMNERARKMSELTLLLEESKKNSQTAEEHNDALQMKLTDVEKKLLETNRKNEQYRVDEIELHALLEDFRANFDRLTTETKQKTITIDSLNEELANLHDELKRREHERKSELDRLSGMEKDREAELRKDYEHRLQVLTTEKETTIRSVRDKSAELEQVVKGREALQEEIKLLQVEIDKLRKQLDDGKKTWRKDLEEMTAQNEADREEWNDERSRIETNKNEVIRTLRDEIEKLEKIRDEKKERDADREKENDELKRYVDELRDKVQQLEKTIASLEEDRIAKEKYRVDEHAQLIRDKEQVVLHKTQIETEIEIQKRKIEQHDVEIQKLHGIIAEKNSTIHALEQNTMELIEKMEQASRGDADFKDKLTVLEKRVEEYRNARDQANANLTESRRQIGELEDQIRELTRTLQNTKQRNQMEDGRRQETDQKLNQMIQKNRQLEVQLVDRTAKMDISNEVIRKMEQDAEKIMKELTAEKKRIAEFEQKLKHVERENSRLVSELNATRTALETKRESSKSAINDIIVQYRRADEKANEVSIENERLRAESQTTIVKLERAERGRKDLESRIRDYERKVDQYEERLKGMHMAAQQSLITPQKFVEIPRSVSNTALNNTSTSSHSETVTTLLRREPDVSSSMTVTLKFLKERIEQLEKDKEELVAEVQKQKNEVKEKSARLTDALSQLEHTKRSINDISHEKEILESRITSQRQIFLTNEESTRSKEQDMRNMKARINTLEIHLREKESKINQLKNDLAALQDHVEEVESARGRVQQAADAKEHRFRDFEHELDKVVKERDDFSAKLRRITADYESLTRKLDHQEAERERLLHEIDQERANNHRNRLAIEEFQKIEQQWKTSAANGQRKLEEDSRRSLEQKRMEEKNTEMNSRNALLTLECDKLRKEVKDYLLKINHLSNKNIDGDRRNEELTTKMLLLTQNVDSLKRFEDEWRALERDMRDELKVLRKEKLVWTAEYEELKRRTQRVEKEKKEVDGVRARLEREIAALKRHLDAMEEEKTKMDYAVKETVTERRAIEKSLAAMEKENSQLYRQCSQLQSQIEQLEKDAGNKSVAKLAKEHAQLEQRIHYINEEKRQLQVMLEQKEANYVHKRRLLTSQIGLLRDQLDEEKKKRVQHIRSESQGRRAMQQKTTAFRKTTQRSSSCDRMVYEEEIAQYAQYTMYTPDDTPPLSNVSQVTFNEEGTII